MKKIDLFKANKEMSPRVENYVKCRVLRKAINKQYSDKIQAAKTSMENLDKLVGSIREDSIDTQKEYYLGVIDELIKKRDEQLKREATFEFTQADKDFKKALKGITMDSPQIADAVIAWFNAYNLDVTDSTLLADIVSAIGGKEDFHHLVDTDGLDGITVDNNRALSMLYWVAFRHMATVGTIKPAQVPEIIKDNFGKKAADAKKAAKKAQKDAEKKVA